mmetsp:Transcript_42732/g.121175  ORF Transcript_42732/g.121175 Transcript_42732/m.121175 type:complete len:356 (+) Transcript_42732:175-1242(+)
MVADGRVVGVVCVTVGVAGREAGQRQRLEPPLVLAASNAIALPRHPTVPLPLLSVHPLGLLLALTAIVGLIHLCERQTGPLVVEEVAECAVLAKGEGHGVEVGLGGQVGRHPLGRHDQRQTSRGRQLVDVSQPDEVGPLTPQRPAMLQYIAAPAQIADMRHMRAVTACSGRCVTAAAAGGRRGRGGRRGIGCVCCCPVHVDEAGQRVAAEVLGDATLHEGLIDELAAVCPADGAGRADGLIDGQARVDDVAADIRRQAVGRVGGRGRLGPADGPNGALDAILDVMQRIFSRRESGEDAEPLIAEKWRLCGDCGVEELLHTGSLSCDLIYVCVQRCDALLQTNQTLTDGRCAARLS